MLPQKPNPYRKCYSCGYDFLPFVGTEAYCPACMTAMAAHAVARNKAGGTK